MFLKHLSLDVGRRFKEFPVVRVKGVWRIGDGLHGFIFR